MHRYAKPFAVIVALGWIAAWAVALLLMWRSGSEASISATDFDALATIDATDTARWIGTAVAALAIALAVPVVLAALRPAPARLVTPAATRDDDHPVVPDHPVTERTPERDREEEELPASLRRASTATPTEPVVAMSRVEPPLAQTEPGDKTPVRTNADSTSIEARLERHEDELRRLRELLARQGTRPDQEPALPERENSHAVR
jgi:hypothetical protein